MRSLFVLLMAFALLPISGAASQYPVMRSLSVLVLTIALLPIAAALKSICSSLIVLPSRTLQYPVMRSLSVLLLAIALLPHSAAVKCHIGVFYKVNEEIITSVSTVQDCPTYCAWDVVDDLLLGVQVDAHVWECATEAVLGVDCTNIKKHCGYGRRKGTFLGDVVDANSVPCCCEGDLCNGLGDAPKPPAPGAHPTSNPMVLPRDAGKCYKGVEVDVDGIQVRAESEGTIETCHSTVCAWATGETTRADGKKLTIRKWGCGEEFVASGYLGTKKCQTVSALMPLFGKITRLPMTLCRCEGHRCNGLPGTAPKPSGSPLTVKCYAGLVEKRGDDITKNIARKVVTCANTQVCVWIEGKPIVEGKTTTVTQWKCAEEWEASGFGDKKCENGRRWYAKGIEDPAAMFCYCIGDLCNGAIDVSTSPGPDVKPIETTAKPTVPAAKPAFSPTILLSLAAVVAMIAALI